MVHSLSQLLHPSPDDVIEIRGKDVILRRGETTVLKVNLAQFVRALSQHTETTAFPDGSSIHESVRFIYKLANATVVVIELPPQVRQILWISPSSAVPFGPDAKYQLATLAFPYIVIIVLFIGPNISGYQQLFYRTEPLTFENDPLCLPNLLNVAEGYGQKCWLCLTNMNIADVAVLNWNKKVSRIIEYFWQSGFNRSSEHHEHNSLWQKMTALKLDPRLSTLEAWERTTREDPLFVLKVPWKPADLTVKQVASSMLSQAFAAFPINTSADLITLLCSTAARAPATAP